MKNVTLTSRFPHKYDGREIAIGTYDIRIPFIVRRSKDDRHSQKRDVKVAVLILNIF